MACHIIIIYLFLWIPENVTLRDTFSCMLSTLSIDFIDAITSQNIFLDRDNNPDFLLYVQAANCYIIEASPFRDSLHTRHVII
jgi:hypothetical protein